MQSNGITVIVAVLALLGCSNDAPVEESVVEISTEIRIVSNDLIEFGGESYSAEQIELLMDAVDQLNSAGGASPDVRVVLLAAPEVHTGLVQHVMYALRERGFDTVSLRLLSEETAAGEESARDAWLEALEAREIAVAPNAANDPENVPDIPPVHITLRAADDGSFNQLYFGQNPLGNDVPQCFQRLHNQVAGLIGAGGTFVDEVAIELDAAESLPFQYAFATFVACAGRQDAKGRWIEYVQTLRFGDSDSSPSSSSPSGHPATLQSPD